MNEQRPDRVAWGGRGRRLLTITFPLCLGLTLLLLMVARPPAGAARGIVGEGTEAGTGPGGALLDMIVLAFDNRATSPANLAPYYTPVMQEIISATLGHPDKRAVVLADRGGSSDTQIVVVYNGVATTVSGLPDPNGVLTTALTEFDVTDSNALGGFMRWARANFQADKTIFSYVGHGTALVPAANIAGLFPPSVAPAEPDSYAVHVPLASFPLPTHLEGNPDFTDHHPLRLLSPYTLSLALAMGTDDGLAPLTVLDLVHCFAGTIEEFYELYPYAATMTGAPNYAYFDPVMPGQALAALQPTMTAVTMAGTIVQRYDAVLPLTAHPRALVAVDSRQIPAIKPAWDMTAYWLANAYDQNASATQAGLANAYLAAANVHYDTTLCTPQDWALAPPDALSDLATFAHEVANQFSSSPLVSSWALTTELRANQAVIATIQRNGQPWFGGVSPPTWTFGGVGIGLYTDFAPMTVGSQPYLSWQSHWYTKTASAGNPHPYGFISGGSSGITWADIFARFWASGMFANGDLIRSAACLPEFPPLRRPGELAMLQVDAQPAPALNAPVTLTGIFSTAQIAINPLAQFTLTQSPGTMLSDLTGTDYLLTGTYPVTASQVWIPTRTGPFSLTAKIDADNRFVEGNENDNTQTLSGLVRCGRPNVHTDGQLDILDVVLVAGHFGQSAGLPGWDPALDQDGNGHIDVADVVLVASVWGQPCP